MKQTGGKMPASPRFNLGWSDRAQPMVNVLWEDAHAFCAWSGGRLLTEAEWEYAARGGSTAARYGPVDDVAWYTDNSGEQRLDGTRLWKEDPNGYWKKLTWNNNRAHSVGQKHANGFGLFDMLGNVAEWVNDWYRPDYYLNSPATDPQGPARGEARVLRGTAWSNGPSDVRVSYHFGGSPAHRGDFNGVRCGGEVFAP
jgi:formylglycine-generating enzyme required for sulfatase activity